MRAAAMRAAPYTIETKPGRNLFGPGCIQQLPAELNRLGLTRALLIGSGSDRSLAQLESVATLLGPLWCDTWAGATNYILPDKVAEAEERCVAGIDCFISVGGGGPVGYGKMLAFRRKLPLVAVATTYSGSETTAQQSMIEAGAKKQYKDPSMLAKLRVYDPDLSLALPVAFSLTSGMNAMAHAVSKLLNPVSNRLDVLHAQEAIRVMASALRQIKSGDEPQLEARTDALYGAWLCGSLIGTTTLQYKIAHVIGGSFKMPHAETHTVTLPHFIAFNEADAAARSTLIRGALGCASERTAAQAMHDLHVELGVPTSLASLGFKEEDLPRAVDMVMAGAATHTENYGTYERTKVEGIMSNMFHGQCP